MALLLTQGFQGTLQWVLHHGYPLLFLIMLIEGPVVTAAGAFAAALNYFNIWAVLGLSIAANLIPDLIYYAIGYWGRERLIVKYGHYIGITKEHIHITEKLAKQHSGKALFAIKMIPLLATPGLIIVGATKMDLKKYAFWCAVITIPTSVGYLILGYYFGAAYNSVEHYLNIGGYIIAAAVVIVVAIAAVQRKYVARYAKKLNQEK